MFEKSLHSRSEASFLASFSTSGRRCSLAGDKEYKHYQKDVKNILCRLTNERNPTGRCGGLRQNYKLEASLGYIVSPCLTERKRENSQELSHRPEEIKMKSKRKPGLVIQAYNTEVGGRVTNLSQFKVSLGNLVGSYLKIKRGGGWGSIAQWCRVFA